MKSHVHLPVSVPPRLLHVIILVILMITSLGIVESVSNALSDYGSAQPLTGTTARLATFNKLPLSFEPNVGQANLAAQYLAHTSNGTLFFTPNEVILALSKSNTAQLSPHNAAPMAPEADSVTLRFLEANPTPSLTANSLLIGKINYFLGDDPNQWHSDVPTYGSLIYQGLYPGIDLTYTGTNEQLKGIYSIAPRADPSRIHWRYDDVKQVTIDDTGNLLIDLGKRRAILVEEVPLAWQQLGSQRIPVSVSYAVAADSSVSFVLGPYDHTQTLLLDPALVYSTFLGGSNFDEGWGIAADWAGNVYITGFTNSSTNFPQLNANQTYGGGLRDAFVTKLNAAGSALIYSTFLGGSLEDVGFGIAVDTSSNVYVTGRTNSTDFPHIRALQNSYGGSDFDGFVTKLNASGQLGLFVLGTYSTYLGGNGGDEGHGIAVDSSSNAYVTGFTGFTLGLGGNTFPKTLNAYQSICGGCENNNYTDAFITKISSGGSLLYSSYLGGGNHEEGKGITVDSANNAYITGYTDSSDFPTRNAYQSNLHGDFDVFVTKLDASGSPHLYSTYLGGQDNDNGYGIAVDTSNSVYVTGYTSSTDFPMQNAYQSSNHGHWDAFVTKFNSAGSGLVYSTYLGGSDYDVGNGITVTSDSHAIITGQTFSNSDFPIVQGLQPGFGGGNTDAFMTKLDTSGTSLNYSTYLGGTGDEGAQSIAVDGYNNAYTTGWTYSSNYPTRIPYQPNFAGTDDGFISKVSAQDEIAPPMYTSSYYIQRTTESSARQLGCDARNRGETGIVVLHFGLPYIISTNPTVYGVQLHNLSSTHMTLDEVKAVIIAFATGYAKPNVSPCTYPSPTLPPQLIIATGISSSALFSVVLNHYIDNPALTYDHGVAWGSMLNSIYQKFKNDASYSGIDIAGAYDAEYYQAKANDTRDPFTGLRSGNNIPNAQVHKWSVHSYTFAWAEGFDSTQPPNGIGHIVHYYNFGSCEDCKRVGSPGTWSATDLDIFDRVYHISWELHTALALPQIYFTPYSYEWYNVRWYIQTTPGPNISMNIEGAMTGCRADPPCTPVPTPVRLQPRFNQACHPQTTCIPQWDPYYCGSCPYLPPSVGWQALGDMLNSPNGPEGTPVSLPPQSTLGLKSSDIIYQP